MSYEELLKNKSPFTPSTTPKEEQRADELTIPSGKAQTKSYDQLTEKLTPEDKKSLDLIKDYDGVKKSAAKIKNSGSDDYSDLQLDMLANQNLSTRNNKGMAELKNKAQDHLIKMPKKI